MARAKTIRKIWAVHDYYVRHSSDNLAESILNIHISKEQQEYVLFHLSMEQCLYQPRSPRIRILTLHKPRNI